MANAWQDAAKTVPVAADGDPIRVVEPEFGSGDTTAPNDAARPVIQNTAGDPDAVFDGVDDDLRVPVTTPGTLFVATKQGMYWDEHDFSADQSIWDPESAKYPVVGWAAIDRVLTPAEIQGLRDYFVARGARNGVFIMRSGVPISDVSFTRNSTGTFLDDAGVLQTAAIDAPRTDYDPVTLAVRGLLVEEQRTNIVSPSENFTAWSTAGASVTSDAIAAPDGNVTADKVVESATDAEHNVFRALPSGPQIFAGRVFAKAAERTQCIVRPGRDPIEDAVIVDLTTGAVVSTGLNILRVSVDGPVDGWYEIRVVADVQLSGTNFLLVGPAVSGSNIYQGDGSSGIYVWGAQVEQAASATSYIPTTTGSVTRSLDNAVSTLTGTPNALSYDITGTAGQDQDAVLWQTDDGSEANRLRLERIAGSLHYIVTSGGVEQANLNLGALTDFTEFTVRIAAAANDFAGSLNGAASVTDATGAMPVGLTTRRIGQSSIGEHWNAWVKDAIETPERLSNTELEA